MKNSLRILIFILPFLSFAQEFGDDRFGVNIGVTNYIMDTNFISSKSAPGFLVGVTGSVPLSDSFEVLAEINFNNHRVKLVGRETETSQPKDLNFYMQNFGVSALIHYKLLELEDFTFGLNLGPTATLLYGYKTKDSNSGYLIDPLYIETRYMDFDSWNEQISFNAFVSLGLSAQYDSFMANLRYYKGITDPYRNTPVYSPFMELKGKDNYWAFSITYFY